MFRSLRYRNFRLFFFGQFISLTGSWMQQLAQSWLVYRLTHNPFHLGMVGFASQVPVSLFSLYAGAVVDRVRRRRMVLWTQSAALAQAALFAALVWTGLIRLWEVYALASVLGLINAFDMPARQVLIGELVEPQDRHNAIALNSTIVNGARIIGPAFAGIIIGWWGEQSCFALNALSYVAVIIALALVRDLRPEPVAPKTSALEQIRGGFSYVARKGPIRMILTMLGVVSMAGMPFVVLLPIFADEILKAGPKGLGLLMGSTGVGATIGALRLAQRSGVRGLDRWIVRTTMFFALMLLGFAFSRWMWLSMLFMGGVGIGLMVQLSGINALLQELSDEQYRGRVMGFYTLMFLGVAPFGSLISGNLAKQIGAPWTVAIGAVACFLTAVRYRRALPASVEEHRSAAPALAIIVSANPRS